MTLTPSERAGALTARRQSIDEVWAEVCAATERKLARVRARVRWRDAA